MKNYITIKINNMDDYNEIMKHPYFLSAKLHFEKEEFTSVLKGSTRQIYLTLCFKQHIDDDHDNKSNEIFYINENELLPIDYIITKEELFKDGVNHIVESTKMDLL